MLFTQRLSDTLKYGAVTLAAMAIASTTLSASIIPLGGGGIVNVANMQGGLVAVTQSTPCIAFSNSTTCLPATTTPIAVSGTDPIFGTSGTIKDIGVTLPIIAFKTVNLTIGGGPAIFDLQSIQTPVGFAPCTFATTSGSCSTGTFVFTQSSPSQVTVSFTTNEIGYLGNSASGSTPYIGVFSTQLSGGLAQFGCTTNCTDTIGNVLQFEADGGTIRSTWSATESPVSGVPEPMSFGLIGSGLVAFGLAFRRRRSA